MLGYKKGNKKLLTGQIPLHFPGDRVYLDGDPTKTVQDKCARKADLTNLDLTGTTNTTGSTIASGTYFYLNGTLVRAKTDIASGATFTLNTNYEVVTVGGALYEQATIEKISTGISGVIAYKCGKLVNLVFTCPALTTSANQWNLIGNLPSELRPKTALLFLGFDNSIAATTVTLLPVQMRIKENGEMLWYSFNDKRTCAPHGVITYFTN